MKRASTVRFSEVADFVNGRAFKPTDWSRSGLPIIRIQNLTGTNEAFNYFEGAVDDRFLVRRNDILISWSASLGVYRWQGPDAVLNQHIFKVRMKNGVDPNYFYHAATSALQEMTARVHGSTMQHITKDRFDTLEITLPNMNEQQRIGRQLNQADRLRSTRRYALEMCEELPPAMYAEFFGDIRVNERKWPLTPLEVTSEIASGVAKGQKYGSRRTEEVPYLRVANVQDGYLDLSEIKSIQALPEDIKALTLQIGDVLMTEGGDFDKLGRGAIWQGAISPCIHQNHIFRVRLNAFAILPIFFTYFLQTPYAKDYFLKCSKQTTNLASINMTQLRATPVPIPPMSAQQSFARFIADYDRLRATHVEALRQADHLFQTLLHQAFSNVE